MCAAETSRDGQACLVVVNCVDEGTTDYCTTCSAIHVAQNASYFGSSTLNRRSRSSYVITEHYSWFYTTGVNGSVGVIVQREVL